MTYVGLLLASLFTWGQHPKRPPKYPWHLVNVWWNSGNATPTFSELAIDFEIVGELSEDVHLYIAPLGLVEIGGIPAYGGVQTSISGWPSKTSKQLVPIGRGGIFSRWSVNDEPLSLDGVTGPAGAHFEADDYEGQFLSVRNRTNWKSGRYTFFLRRSSESEGRWFTASVQELASGRETEIGSLRFDDDNGSLGESIAAFVEVYGSTSIIPQVTVIFSEPRVDGTRRPETSTSISYPDNGTNGSIRFARAKQSGNRVIVTTHPSGLPASAGSDECPLRLCLWRNNAQIGSRTAAERDVPGSGARVPLTSSTDVSLRRSGTASFMERQRDGAPAILLEIIKYGVRRRGGNAVASLRTRVDAEARPPYSRHGRGTDHADR